MLRIINFLIRKNGLNFFDVFMKISIWYFVLFCRLSVVGYQLSVWSISDHRSPFFRSLLTFLQRISVIGELFHIRSPITLLPITAHLFTEVIGYRCCFCPITDYPFTNHRSPFYNSVGCSLLAYHAIFTLKPNSYFAEWFIDEINSSGFIIEILLFLKSWMFLVTKTVILDSAAQKFCNASSKFVNVDLIALATVDWLIGHTLNNS